MSDKEQQSNGKQSDDFGHESKQIRVDKQNNMVVYLALVQELGCLLGWQFTEVLEIMDVTLKCY